MSISVHVHNEICKGVLDLYLEKNSSLPCSLLCKGQGTKSNYHTSKTAIDLGKYEYRTLLIKSWTGFFLLSHMFLLLAVPIFNQQIV